MGPQASLTPSLARASLLISLLPSLVSWLPLFPDSAAHQVSDRFRPTARKQLFNNELVELLEQLHGHITHFDVDVALLDHAYAFFSASMSLATAYSNPWLLLRNRSFSTSLSIHSTNRFSTVIVTCIFGMVSIIFPYAFVLYLLSHYVIKAYKGLHFKPL